MASEPVGHLVPILDEGVTFDRGDHVIVVLDALGPDDVQREIAEICALIGQRNKQQREEET